MHILHFNEDYTVPVYCQPINVLLNIFLIQLGITGILVTSFLVIENLVS